MRTRPGDFARAPNRAFLALVAGGVFSLLAAGAQAGPSLRIATEGAYPPFNYVENDQPAGFEVDLGRALCDAMGATCTFVLQEWETIVAGLKENRYDAIMSSLEITPERRRRVAFSKRYYRVPAALIGAKQAVIAANGAMPDLTGKVIGVIADTEFAGYLESNLKNASVRTFSKYEEANLDLLTGRLDYVLGDKLALNKFLDTREGRLCCRFAVDLPVDRGEGVGVGLRKGETALVDQFNAAIDRVMADGTYDRVRAKYFPFDMK